MRDAAMKSTIKNPFTPKLLFCLSLAVFFFWRSRNTLIFFSDVVLKENNEKIKNILNILMKKIDLFIWFQFSNIYLYFIDNSYSNSP